MSRKVRTSCEVIFGCIKLLPSSNLICEKRNNVKTLTKQIHVTIIPKPQLTMTPVIRGSAIIPSLNVNYVSYFNRRLIYAFNNLRLNK